MDILLTELLVEFRGLPGEILTIGASGSLSGGRGGGE